MRTRAKTDTGCRTSTAVAMVVFDVVKRHGKVDIRFIDAGFALFDVTGLLRFR